ncbi:4-hydroxyphenylpyruvate dioxygenase-like protein [Glandiceps talaboti]
MAATLHHFEVACVDASARAKQFCKQFRFYLFAVNFNDPDVPQYACRSKDSVFVFSQRPEDCVISGDTVFDCALEVRNVDGVFKRAVANGATEIEAPALLKDGNGTIKMAVIGTPVGDVVHTLINSDNYNGVFLPGFNKPTNQLMEEFPTDASHAITTHIDHVTYVVESGTSPKVIKFYQDAFGCDRFKLNLNEDEETGMPVNFGNVEMRLMAAQYWRCAESGVRLDKPKGSTKQTVTFVLAEALWGEGEAARNQIATYLEHHGGPGVQHIALHTENIIDTVRTLKLSGCTFPVMPVEYYTSVGKADEINRVGECLDEMKKLGILLDAEGEFSYDDDQQTEERYLMQSFSAPVFQKKTLFMEIITRAGATGFGAGNITALWRAMEVAHKSYKEEHKITPEGPTWSKAYRKSIDTNSRSVSPVEPTWSKYRSSIPSVETMLENEP